MRSQTRLIGPWTALSAGVATFILSAILVNLGATAAIDRAIMEAVPPLHNAVTKALAIFVSRGLGGFGMSLATALTVAWMFRRRRADALMLAVGMGLAVSAMLVLKFAFARARPDVFPWLDAASNWSFPSGHALSSATYWLLLAVIAKRRWMWGVAIAMTLIAGVFRVIAGVHWPSDVVAGWALGVAFVGAAMLVKARFTRAQPSAINAPL